MKNLPNIFLIGPMGTGKSTLGRALARKLNRPFFDSDLELEKRAGASISWIFDVEGEEGMRQWETKVIADLTQRSPIVLATGGGSVLYSENRVALSTRGTVFYLESSLNQQVKRTMKTRGHRPLLRVENPKQKIIELNSLRIPLYLEIADFTIKTDNRSIDTTLKTILDLVNENTEHSST